MLVRRERPEDFESVYRINSQAFGRPAEADLVDSLRTSGVEVISLVAEDAGELHGHIMFSPVTINGKDEPRTIGLAPMSVRQDLQRRGTGSLLVRTGLEECSRAGWKAAVVLGHPTYYPRFGFVPASRFGLTSEYDVPDDVFMAIELTSGALSGIHGVVKYRREFDGV